MRYMLLVVADESAGEGPDETAARPSPEADPGEPCWAPWARLMASRSVALRDGARLHPTTAATTVRTHGTEVLLSDGPFAETKEQIVGYQVIECADLDAAIEAAAAHPAAASGASIEVRPIVAESG